MLSNIPAATRWPLVVPLVSRKTLSEPIGYLGAALYQLDALWSGDSNGMQLTCLWLGPQLCYFHSQTVSISKESEKQR